MPQGIYDGATWAQFRETLKGAGAKMPDGSYVPLYKRLQQQAAEQASLRAPFAEQPAPLNT